MCLVAGFRVYVSENEMTCVMVGWQMLLQHTASWEG